MSGLLLQEELVNTHTLQQHSVLCEAVADRHALAQALCSVWLCTELAHASELCDAVMLWPRGCVFL
jgi:hypothetical protein